ncbi:hypothetical protein OG216_00910 [Streptomycetaceae bacterium NBC_01309]
MKRTANAALAAGLILCAAAPAAGAGPGAPSAAPTPRGVVPGPAVTLSPNQVLDLPRLNCPSGQTSTGGGLTLSPDNGVFMRSSGPAGVGWEISVHNLSDGPRTVTPLVICTSDPSITHVAGPVVSGETAFSGAQCPAGQVVAGGGAAADHRNFLSYSSDFSEGWHARARNLGSGPSAVAAFVRCSNRPHSDAGNTTGVPVPPGQTRSAHVECPANQVPTAGGGYGDPKLLHNASGPTATGWTIRATNTDSADRSLYATVVCTTP